MAALQGGDMVSSFDWHGGSITRATAINGGYRNTQNVRRFFKNECGEDFKFDRAFMAWLRDDAEKTMGDAADEWLRRKMSGSAGFRKFV
jgi:hypothetical protein